MNHAHESGRRCPSDSELSCPMHKVTISLTHAAVQAFQSTLGFFTLVPLVSPHYLLLPLIFLVTQFYPTLSLCSQMRQDAVSVHFNVTYRMDPLQTFTIFCAAASSSPIPTPTIPLPFASAARQPASSPGWLLLHRRVSAMLNKTICM
jgi:hypothetical protein